VKADVVIIGGGPGGSVCAMQLLERGIQPVIVEGVAFPRFSIGESLTGECGMLLRGLGLEDVMTARQFPVKHGVQVFGTGGRNAFYVPVMARGPSGLEAIPTWQVLRSEFDRMLLETAMARGAQFVRATVRDVIRSDGRVSGLIAEGADGARMEIASRFVADASGRSTFLANRRVTGQKTESNYCRQIAIFAHFHGARRADGPLSGDTLIFYRSTFEWAWFIPVGPEVTSIGIVLPAEQLRRSDLDPEAFFTRESLALNPALQERMEHATRTTPVRTLTNYSYAVSDFAGPGFICIGDAHRFTDPIFSFGVYMTTREATLAAQAIAASLDETEAQSQERLQHFMVAAEDGQDIIASVIDVFWGFPLAFQRMAHRTHRDGMIDVFAGRIHPPPTEAGETVSTLRELRAKAAARIPAN
jgi:flavin-dependent dehydrogenase